MIVHNGCDFKGLLAEEELQQKHFLRRMGSFHPHHFYLTQEVCDVMNITMKDSEEKFANDLLAIRIVYENLKPDPEMIDSYYRK